MPPNRGFKQPERLCVTDQLAKALESLRRGGLAVLIDDRDRENEGDVVVAAEFVTADAITFMAEHCRTMITIPMTAARLARLGIGPMVKVNNGLQNTAFTVSVDYRHDTTTGSSAEDRAKTIRALVDERGQTQRLRVTRPRLPSARPPRWAGRAARPHRGRHRIDEFGGALSGRGDIGDPGPARQDAGSRGVVRFRPPLRHAGGPDPVHRRTRCFDPSKIRRGRGGAAGGGKSARNICCRVRVLGVSAFLCSSIGRAGGC